MACRESADRRKLPVRRGGSHSSRECRLRFERSAYAPSRNILRRSPSHPGAATPQANLFGDNGQLVATHFAGPTWQARDGSTVVGQKVNAVTVDPTAVPWLLLSAKSTAAGPDGDRLVDTTFIQRVATTGGIAPATTECTAAGKVAAVPYTADYYFWKATGRP
ncbi:MAG TPA: DUF3455 domain-containing protein [Pseudonocardia sp.]